MADASLQPIRSRIRLQPRLLGVVLVLAVASIGSSYALGLLSTEAVQNFTVVFTSLLLQALPLVALGALVAAAIAVLVPAAAFARLGRLPSFVQVPAAAVAAFAFPVCECGSVPVARQLAARGLRPSAAITFMLAAPIVNPIVVAATAVAYSGRGVLWGMVVGRVGIGLAAATAAGWVLGAWRKDELLRDQERGGDGRCACAAGCHSCSGTGECSHEERSRWRAFFTHLGDDFVFMGKFLVLGVAMAALLQTIVPQSALASLASTQVIAILVMIVLAFALSLCSESDAFVAASFVQFGPAAQLAFLVFGPLVDAKLVFLYGATFRRGFVAILVGVVAAVTLAGTLWMGVVLG